MTWQNPSLSEIASQFKSTKRVGIVGISAKPDRASYGVAQYLRRFFTIIPVNPQLHEWEGLRAYPSLTEIPAAERPDLVVVFRKSSEVAPIFQEVAALGIRAIWLQQGIIDEQSGAEARSRGAFVVMDACAAVLHRQVQP